MTKGKYVKSAEQLSWMWTVNIYFFYDSGYLTMEMAGRPNDLLIRWDI